MHFKTYTHMQSYCRTMLKMYLKEKIKCWQKISSIQQIHQTGRQTEGHKMKIIINVPYTTINRNVVCWCLCKSLCVCKIYVYLKLWNFFIHDFIKELFSFWREMNPVKILLKGVAKSVYILKSYNLKSLKDQFISNYRIMLLISLKITLIAQYPWKSLFVKNFGIQNVAVAKV